MGAGTYTVGAPIGISKAIHVHGAVGQARPRVVNPGSGVFNMSNGARVSDMTLEATGNVLTVAGSAVAERLTVVGGPGPAASAASVQPQALLRDSVVSTAATNGTAVYAAHTGNNAPARLVNVTAIATHAGGIGVLADSSVGGICVPPFNVEIHLTNTIARGGQYDLSVPDICSGLELITVAHSNFRAAKVNQASPGSRVVSQGGNQEAEPLFAAPAALDFHQLAGSATIDAGTPIEFLGTADVDGEPRSAGSWPDIGGDEFQPPAPPPPPGPEPDRRAPVASLLAATPSTFRAVGPARRAARRRPKGTRISYALDEAASVRFTARRAVRRRGRTLYRRVRGSLTHAGQTGGNTFRFSGRLGARKLRPGRYRLAAVPTDAAGNAGAAVRATFRVVR